MVVAVSVLVLFAMVLAILKRQAEAAARDHEEAALAEQDSPDAMPNQPVNLFAKL